MPNKRHNLAVRIQTPGGDNPLLLFLFQQEDIFNGVPVTSGLFLQAKGGTPGYVFKIVESSASQLPPGLDLNESTGQITGTPTESGTFTFLAQVQDSNNQVYPASFSIIIRPKLIVLFATPLDGEIFEAYRYRLVVKDLDGNTITSGFTLDDGNLPDGLSLSSAGVISGTPQLGSEGTSYARIKVAALSDEVTFRIDILIWPPLAGTPPVKRQLLYAGQAFIGLPFTAPAGGGRPPYSYTFDNLSDFPWIAFDRSTATFKGTPPSDQIGVEQTITATITDSLHATASVAFKFVILLPITTVNGVLPIDEEGGLTLTSPDGSLKFEPNSAGELTVVVAKLPVSGISAINSASPDSSGNVELFSGDSSLSFNSVPAGVDIRVAVPIGGLQSINAIPPDSSGNLLLTSPDNSVFIEEDSNGNLGFRVAIPAPYIGVMPGVLGSAGDGDFDLDGVNTYPGILGLVGSIYSQLSVTPIYARNFRVRSGITLDAVGNHIRCTGDFTNEGTIQYNGGNAGNGQAAGTVGGTGGIGAFIAAGGQTLGVGVTGATGGISNTANGSGGGAGVTPTGRWQGGQGGAGGAGGAGSGGAAGAGGAASSSTAYFKLEYLEPLMCATGGAAFAIGLIAGGRAGAGGGGGGGNGTLRGGSGGGGGGSAGVFFIAARRIVRSGTGLIRFNGGNGGNGGSPTGGSNQGGGGAGGGGAGGWGVLAYGSIVGAGSLTLQSNGGNGGDGGLATSGGTNGVGALGGDSGFILMFDLTSGACMRHPIQAGAANAGRIGGGGGVNSVSL